jgi:hypothetical protein
MFYVKKKNSTELYLDKGISSLIVDLVNIQNESRCYREIFCHHIATILNFDIVGTNSLRFAWNGSNYGTHAEMAVLQQLPCNFSKRVIPIDILVIRTTATGDLRNSKPCAKCLKHMARIEINRYRIRNIFYSDDDGIIVCESFKNLSNDKNKYLCKSQRRLYNLL